MASTLSTRHRLLSASFAQSKLQITIGLGAALGVSVLLFFFVNTLLLFSWFLLICSAYALQFWLQKGYHADAQKHSERHWSVFRTISTAITSGLWVSVSLFYAPSWPLELQLGFGIFLLSFFIWLLISNYLSLASTVAASIPISIFALLLLMADPTRPWFEVGLAILVVVALLLACVLSINRFIAGRLNAFEQARELIDRCRKQIEKYSTDNKMAKFALTEQQELVRLKDAVMQSAQESVMIIDENGQIIDANLAAAALFRQQRRQIINQPADQFLIAVESGKPLSQQFDLMLQRGDSAPQSLQTEVMLARADGSGILVEISCTPLAVTARRLTRVSLSDITDRRRVQMRLQESETRYRTLFNNNPSICITLSPTGYVLDINAQGAQHLGFQNGEALKGKRIANLLPQGDRSKSVRYLRQATLEPGRTFRFEHSVVGADGQTLRVRASAVSIRSGSELQLLLVWEDITETDELNRKLRWQASHDSLTGLLNRQAMEQNLQVLIEEADESQQHAYCLIDLDQFKIVNDTAGHPAGDELLRQVAKMMASCLRERDVLARIGGDEFSIILIDCPPSKATDIAERLRETIERFRFVWNENSFRIGLSIGLVVFEPKKWNMDRVLISADAACYVAKDRGKNRVEVFEASEHNHDDRELREIQSAISLSEHIKQGRFKLLAQVIHPLHPKDKPRLELLARMKTDTDELLLPGVFLGALDRFNIISELDSWVIDTALEWIKDNFAAMEQLESVSINLSARAISDSAIEKQLLERLAENPELAQFLVIEIQETALMSNLTKANEFIDTLKAVGVSFAVDDFGTGLSAFDFLKERRFKYIKIDARFISQLSSDPLAQAMVKSISEISALLDLKTVAESVEDQAALPWLQTYNIDYSQGFIMSYPEECADALARIDTLSE